MGRRFFSGWLAFIAALCCAAAPGCGKPTAARPEAAAEEASRRVAAEGAAVPDIKSYNDAIRGLDFSKRHIKYMTSLSAEGGSVMHRYSVFYSNVSGRPWEDIFPAELKSPLLNEDDARHIAECLVLRKLASRIAEVNVSGAANFLPAAVALVRDNVREDAAAPALFYPTAIFVAGRAKAADRLFLATLIAREAFDAAFMAAAGGRMLVVVEEKGAFAAASFPDGAMLKPGELDKLLSSAGARAEIAAAVPPRAVLLRMAYLDEYMETRGAKSGFFRNLIGEMEKAVPLAKMAGRDAIDTRAIYNPPFGAEYRLEKKELTRSERAADAKAKEGGAALVEKLLGEISK